MSDYKVVLPAMGEGVMEATIIAWTKQIGEFIEEDETLVEIATDKVDSEVPAPVSGTIKELLVPVDGVAAVNTAIAVIETDGAATTPGSETSNVVVADTTEEDSVVEASTIPEENQLLEPLKTAAKTNVSVRYDGMLSPLVKTMVEMEGITPEELSGIQGSGKEGRITKDDITAFLASRGENPTKVETSSTEQASNESSPMQESTGVQATAPASSLRGAHAYKTATAVASGQDEIIEMDRMRKLIAKHMVDSKQTSPHVTSFVEADMTNIVMWRNKNKAAFLQATGQKLTFMPLLIHALIKSIRDFPMINASVKGDTIIKKKDINIGMAAALPNGNLIVPVIKRADQLSLRGLTERINDLAERSRNNKLKPDEVTEGTYTITNLGSFGNIMGTPIINQPQVAIMAVGAIQKKPAVLETPQGDVIAVRHKMYLSHAYDHRVVDGALGGMFVKRMAEYLEGFDPNTEI